MEDTTRQADSKSKYAAQVVDILKSAPIWQWPSIFIYMFEVLIYRLFKKRIRKEISLNLYGLNFVIKTHNMDLGVIYEIFSEGIYLKDPNYIPQDGWTCVDVGANIGCVSLTWAQRDPHGKIYAMEPHPATFERLERNVNANRFSNVTCFNIAADRQSGTLEFLISDQTSMGVSANEQSATAASHKMSARICQVPALSLDDFYDKQKIPTVDLLKIDIEGHEVACLEGATRALRRTRRVVLEYHSAALRISCREIFAQAGFSLNEAGDLIFAENPQWPPALE